MEDGGQWSDLYEINKWWRKNAIVEQNHITAAQPGIAPTVTTYTVHNNHSSLWHSGVGQAVRNNERTTKMIIFRNNRTSTGINICLLNRQLILIKSVQKKIFKFENRNHRAMRWRRRRGEEVATKFIVLAFREYFELYKMCCEAIK